MMIKKSVKWVGLVCFLLLSGCAHKPCVHRYFQVQAPAQREAHLAAVKDFRVEGVFSIHQLGRRAEIANYVWDEFSRKNYRIHISSALGLYQVEIHYQFGTVKLWKNGTHVSTAKTPEGLMQNALGWSLPVSQMRDWIKGIPAENAGHYMARYDVYGHLITLAQNGWVLDFSRYKTTKDDIDYPSVITMERSGFFVKIIVRKWFWYMQPYTLPDVL